MPMTPDVWKIVLRSGNLGVMGGKPCGYLYLLYSC
jgi:hypothetical protein